ncbi:L,D-transpeptidase family protein [Paenibacillus hamazuiensis]|uniref:L,D-transpeptidase family protein n=1 Tax=Paenibacillus hamazuiensis TaxID=2936508 RepID=UPI00200DAAF0|nr:L,D-transpeptidase family protein [Paenibacillus hamazuiensis]
MDRTSSRFKSHLDEKVVHLHKNLYINRSDPMYYEKVLRYLDPKSPEAHYKVGQKYEQQGAKEKAVYHYNECMKTYPSPYYYDASGSLRRLGRNPAPPPRVEMPSPPQAVVYRSRPALPYFWKVMLVALLLLNLILLGLFLGKDSIPLSVSALKPWGVGKEITYESVEMPFIMYFPYDKPHKDVEQALYDQALGLAKTNPGQHIWIYGIAKSGSGTGKKAVPMTDAAWKQMAFVVAEYNLAEDRTVKIRFLNTDFQKLKPVTEAGANLVRTALEAYIADTGAAPISLDELVRDYPHNYLSFIPKEAQSGLSRIARKYDGSGGWVYDASAAQVRDMFYPNVPGERGAQAPDFGRYRLVVGKSGHSLQLLSGSTLLMEKEVGLGATDSTPEGTFTVTDRVKEPQGQHPGVYGNAALGMGGIAIHGTNAPESIGKDMSLGCIRMANADMEELYPLVPRGTLVSIGDQPQSGVKFASVEWNPGQLAPAAAGGANETANGKVFYWLG